MNIKKKFGQYKLQKKLKAMGIEYKDTDDNIRDTADLVKDICRRAQWKDILNK